MSIKIRTIIQIVLNWLKISPHNTRNVVLLTRTSFKNYVDSFVSQTKRITKMKYKNKFLHKKVASILTVLFHANYNNNNKYNIIIKLYLWNKRTPYVTFALFLLPSLMKVQYENSSLIPLPNNSQTGSVSE